MLTILDLFSGIGGFSLGLERTGGFRTVAFCEQDAYATAVLNKHWPGVPVFGDVRQLGADTLAGAGVARPDVICGGFPCQDISLAGKGAGLEGARSGLWFEFARLIGELRPRYVVAENVAALRSRGLDTVLGCLSALGYDAEWHCIPAAAVGAPHKRDRVWIVAYSARGIGSDKPGVTDSKGALVRSGAGAGSGDGRRHTAERIPVVVGSADATGVAHAVSCRCEQGGLHRARDHAASGKAANFEPCHAGADVPDAGCQQHESRGAADGRQGTQIVSRFEQSDAWIVEPDVGRVAHGVPRRVDRLRCLGNAVVPQIPEVIGRAILSHAYSVSQTNTGAAV